MLTKGLEGHKITPARSGVLSAASNGDDNRADEAPSKRNPDTRGSHRRLTKYVWKGKSPSSVSTIVLTGSSDIGTIECLTPNALAMVAVESHKLAPPSS